MLSMPNVAAEQIVFLRSEFVRRGWFLRLPSAFFSAHVHGGSSQGRAGRAGRPGPRLPGLFWSLRRPAADDFIPSRFYRNPRDVCVQLHRLSREQPQKWAESSGRQRDSGVQNFSVSALRVCTELATKSRAKAAPGGGEAGAAHDHGG